MGASKYTRRKLLKMCVLSAVFGKLFVRNAIASASLETALADKLLSTIHDKSSASELGYCYLCTCTATHDLKKLVNDIYINHPEKCEKIKISSENETRALVKEMFSEDFKNGKIINLDNWILSETEVKICALMHLMVKT